MKPKNKKLSISVLLGSFTTFSVALSPVLSSCSELNLVMLYSIDDIRNYLEVNTHYLNPSLEPEDKVIQDPIYVLQGTFKDFLNKNLDIQNIANALVQSYSWTIPEDAGFVMAISVGHKHLFFECNVPYRDGEVTHHTKTVCSFTFEKGKIEGNNVSPARLFGHVKTYIDGEYAETKYDFGDEGAILYCAQLASVGLPQLYNMLLFSATENWQAETSATMPIFLSGAVEPETLHISTQDTTNVEFYFAI